MEREKYIRTDKKSSQEKPNESQKLGLVFEEKKEERLTMDGPELVTVLRIIGTRRQDD